MKSLPEKTILIVGNPTDDADSYPFRMLENLSHSFPKLFFTSWDPTEELPNSIHTSVLCIDTVEGISKPTLFKNLDDFLISPRTTVHDFDLPIALKLLLKIKKIKKVSIIGIPKKTDKDTYRHLCSMLQAI